MNICVDVRGLLVGVLSLIFFLFIHITYLFTYFTYQQVSPPFLHSKSLTPPPFGPPPTDHLLLLCYSEKGRFPIDTTTTWHIKLN